MIKGMTGFGNAQISFGKVRGIIEIKSQNHRYLDIVYYLPIGFSSTENKIKQLISRNSKRGRITVSFKIVEKPLQKVSFNKEAVKEYLRQAKSLKREFGFNDELSLAAVVRLPGVVEAKETLLDPNEVWPAIEKGFKKAENSLLAMRKREGKALAADTSSVLKKMLQQIKKIKVRKKVLVQERKKKASPDEFLAFQKASDINEEITRLTHYVEEFKLLLKSTGSVGKKLDFVAQEMQRETNTIGSKVQDKVVSNAVIALKSKIEKLREQAQNIE